MLSPRAFKPRRQNSHRADEWKSCPNCGEMFCRPPGIGTAQWEGRVFCSPSCSSQKPIRERLRQHSRDEGDCRVWTGALNMSGYGQLFVRRNGVRKCWSAHRLAFQELVGSIPDGLIVMHTCDNPACIKPEHLKLGTHADNMADKVAKGRHRSPPRDKNGSAKINQAGVAVILDSRLPAQTLATAFGVTLLTIHRIRREARRAN